MATTNVQITPTRSTLAQRIIALGVVFAFFYWASSIVMTLMLAVLLAYFLDPAVVLLERLHIPRALGALVVLLVAIAAVGAIGYLLVNRTQSFAYAWPRYSAVLRRAAESVDRKIGTIERAFSITVPEQAPTQPSVSANEMQEVRSWLLHGIGTITSGLLLWAFLPFLVFFMLVAKPRLWHATIELFSDASRADVRSALDDVNVVLRSYVARSSLVAGILAAACWIFFAIMQLDSAIFDRARQVAQHRPVFNRGRGTQRLAFNRCECAYARDCGPQRSPERAGSHRLVVVLGMAVGRLRTDPGHSHYGDAQSGLRSRARLAAFGTLAGRLTQFVVKSATI